MALAGCGSAAWREQAIRDEKHTQKAEMQVSYLAACRLLLPELRHVYGESQVFHDVWPDLQEATIQAVAANSRGLVVLIKIKATGPESCQVSWFFADPVERVRARPALERALGTMPEAAKR
jgi:hypothetical protein